MSDRDMTIPTGEAAAPEETANKRPKMTQEEADYVERVFFEEDDKVRLRDGKEYRIPPLGLKDARILMRKLNTLDTTIILSNLIDADGEDRYDELMDVLMMGFRPYYKHMTREHLEEYIDLGSAKQIVDSMIGLNSLKKSLL